MTIPQNIEIMKTMENMALFAIAVTVVASFLYFLLLDGLNKWRQNEKKHGLTIKYLIRKPGGFLLLGLLPGCLAWFFFGFGPLQAGLAWGGTGSILPWIAGTSALLILLNFVNSRNVAVRARYPEFRIPDWRPADLLLAAGSWLVYLTGYEYLFRGILLFSCYQAFGTWSAVVINLALYSALHLPKGMKEAIAAIPFGALLCFLTLQSHSILAAIIIHAVQAISCEVLCIWHHPEMTFKFKKSLHP